MKQIERTQTGLRLEKRLVKVMKALAEHFDISVADLVEGTMLHVLEGKAPPFGETTLRKIAQMKEIYDLDLDASDAHKLHEGSPN